MSQKRDVFTRKEPCEQCRRSRRFFIEDGLTWCDKCGLVQQGIATQQDEDDFGNQGRKARVKRQSHEKVPQIYSGSTATELFLQAYQLILWKQCYALINTIGLPSELETVVKDLWALRLQLLKSKTDATTDEDTIFSSQPQSEAENEGKNNDVGKVKKVKGKAMPTLIESLGLCYLGMMLLRLPVSIGEIHRWAVREDVPYIRAIRWVPLIMKQKLRAEYMLALDTTSPLKPDDIRKTTHNLVLYYKHHFDLTFPPLNAPLLLFKHIRDLALPITIFPAFRRIASLLSIDFSFPTSGHRQRTSLLPEVSLICLLVVAVKLYYPFDNLPRHAHALTDPAVLDVNWDIWTEAQQSHASRINPEGHLPRGSEINVTEDDVMEMSGEQLDDYLDWYERTWVDDERTERKPRGVPKQLLDMFPTGRLDGSHPLPYNYNDQRKYERESIEQNLAVVMGGLELRDVIAEDGNGENRGDVRRIGNCYKRYRTTEDLSPHARMFYQAAANVVAVKLETLLMAVLQIEERLIVWRQNHLKFGIETKESIDSDREEKAGGGSGMDVEISEMKVENGGRVSRVEQYVKDETSGEMSDE